MVTHQNGDLIPLADAHGIEAFGKVLHGLSQLWIGVAFRSVDNGFALRPTLRQFLQQSGNGSGCRHLHEGSPLVVRADWYGNFGGKHGITDGRSQSLWWQYAARESITAIR